MPGVEIEEGILDIVVGVIGHDNCDWFGHGDMGVDHRIYGEAAFGADIPDGDTDSKEALEDNGIVRERPHPSRVNFVGLVALGAKEKALSNGGYPLIEGEEVETIALKFGDVEEGVTEHEGIVRKAFENVF